MIDFLKILVTDTAFIEKIYNDDRLIFHNSREKLSHFDFETIHSKVTRIYKGILFCFNDNSYKYYSGHITTSMIIYITQMTSPLKTVFR